MTSFTVWQRNLILPGLLLLGTFVFFLFSRHQKNPAYSLKINEICTLNTGTNDGMSVMYADYIELYNPTDQEISLENLSLSDKSDNDTFTLLPSVSIAPGGYYVVYAAGTDGSVPEGYTSLPFAISAEETIRLSYKDSSADGTLHFSPVDSVFVPALELGTVYGRTKDGSDTFAQMHPSPGLSNSTSSLLIEPPQFSVESGFYENMLQLELTAPEEFSIYYTLDGSEPSMDSFLYTEPLTLSDPSSRENVYAARDDIAAISTQYAVPKEPVDKAVIVRAAAFDKDGNHSHTVTATYFLGFEDKTGYEDSAVLSLVTDPGNLFDHNTGIYIRGKLYQDGLEQGRILPDFPWIELMDYTNYYMEGSSSERAAYLSFFDREHQLSFQQNCGIRIRGNESRSFPQKSFTLFARKRYGKETFSSVFSDSHLSYPDLILNNSKRLRKVFFLSLVEDRAFAVQKYTPCQVFLNGEYWGMYYLMEKYSAEYLEGYYEIPAEDSLLIKAGYEVQDGSPEDLSYFKDLQEYLEQDLSDPKLYEGLLEMMDMQSFIDWMCTNIYIGNTDTKPLGGNVFTWRTLHTGNAKYQDGKWRWMLYDVDDSFSVGIDTSVTPAYAIDSFAEHAGYAPCGFLKDTPMPSLMKNADFRKQFVLTFMDMANENFRAERVVALLNEIAEQYTPWAEKSYERWNTNPLDIPFTKQVEEIRTYFTHRFDAIVPYLAKHFGLKGEVAPFSLWTDSAAGGTVTLNTLTPDLTKGAWEGKYYTDYPVTLTAAPRAGYTFSGWEISGGELVRGTASDREIQVQLSGEGTSVRAVFTKEASSQT